MRSFLLVLFALAILLFLIPFVVDWLYAPVSPPESSHKRALGTTEIVLNDSTVYYGDQEYPVLEIGRQRWLGKNMKNLVSPCEGTKILAFQDGSRTPPHTDAFYTLSQPNVAFYNNDPSAPGALYNYAAVRHCSLCPPGYRIPSVADWRELLAQLGGGEMAGQHLLAPLPHGFNADPGGRIDAYGSVLGGDIGFYWTADPLQKDDPVHSSYYTVEIWSSGVHRILPQDGRVGNYVRCVWNEQLKKHLK